MNCKCIGCGITLQNDDICLPGFIKNIDSKYCERCFRIKNYNEYQKVDKSIGDFYNIIEKINVTDDLVLLVVDLMSIGEELKRLVSKLKNKPLIVISKRDIFSYKVKDQKLINLLSIPCLDKIVVSANKNYNIDLLLEKINLYKKSKIVYLVGLTNSGKSTLINKIIYNYTDLESSITTSMLPSTTLDTIEIRINDNLTLIDTPGIIDDGNISNYLDNDLLKKLFIKREIKPITYQVKCKQYFLIDDFIKIECLEPCDMTFYISNRLKITRFFKNIETDFNKQQLVTIANCDIVINGLGFIAINREVKINVFTYDGVEIYIREK